MDERQDQLDELVNRVREVYGSDPAEFDSSVSEPDLDQTAEDEDDELRLMLMEQLRKNHESADQPRALETSEEEAAEDEEFVEEEVLEEEVLEEVLEEEVLEEVLEEEVLEEEVLEEEVLEEEFVEEEVLEEEVLEEEVLEEEVLEEEVLEEEVLEDEPFEDEREDEDFVDEESAADEYEEEDLFYDELFDEDTVEESLEDTLFDSDDDEDDERDEDVAEERMAEPSDDEDSEYTVQRSMPLQVGVEGGAYRKDSSAVSGAKNRREAWSDGDVDMLLKLGYEPALRNVVDEEWVEQRKNACLRDDVVGTRNDRAYVCHEKGITDPSDTEGVEAAYRREITRVRARLFGTLMGMFLTLALCIIGRLWRANQTEEGGAVVCTAAILVCVVLTVLPQFGRLWRGLRSLFDYEPVAYALPAVAVVATLLYDVAALIRPQVWSDGLWLNLVALGSVLTAILAELWQGLSQQISFRMVSSGKPLSVISGQQIKGKDHPLAFGETDAQADVKEAVGVRIRTVRRPGQYFAWVNRYNDAFGTLNYLLPAMLLLAVSFGGAIMMVHTSIEQGLMTALLSFVVTLPCALAIGLTWPTYRINRHLQRHGCTILGDAAANQYGRSRKATGGEQVRYLFADRDAFHKKVTLRVDIRENEDAALYQQQTRKLFRLLDGMEALDWENTAVDTESVRIEISDLKEGFLKLYMSDRGRVFEVMMGSYHELSKRGVQLPKENMERVYRRQAADGDGEIMYVAFDGVTRSACLVTYQVKSKFKWAVKKMRELGYTVGILTYDPLLTCKTAVGLDKDVPVIYRKRLESQEVEQDGGIVSVDGGIKAVYAMISCRRIRESYGAAGVLAWFLSLDGMVVLLGLSLVSPSILHHPLLAVGVMMGQIIWNVAVCMIGKRYIDAAAAALPERDYQERRPRKQKKHRKQRTGKSGKTI